ncbi:MAG TPA: COX15/CtaA family protein [Solirubrobacteraceae bacterium]|jgi:cytochrome c oxidase assembly protein subunit 15
MSEAPNVRARLRARTNGYTVDPERYALLARAALAMLTLIVLTGAAVRVTGSGLGCPTWPKCTDASLYTQLNLHGLIEFGNRVLTFFVSLATIAAFAGAIRRRPFRRDLVWLSLLLPLGVVAQAVLGGFTVLYDLAPGFVMSHYILSMLILVACVALDWRAHHEPASREPRVAVDRRLAFGARALIPIGAITIFAGTAASAAGPHAGGEGTHDVVKRLTFKGADTLRFVVEQHARLATVVGLLAVALWLLARRTGVSGERRRPLTVLCCLLAAQGVVGGVQYWQHLPAEIVWVHVALAAMTWLAILRTVAELGRPLPRGLLGTDGRGDRDEPAPPVAATEPAGLGAPVARS